MQIQKLFNVLVMGGALLSAGSIAQPQSTPIEGTSTPLQPAFCSSDAVCVPDGQGKKKVKEGFVCCWGTSCETKSE